MSTYRITWPCCGDTSETEAWEPEECPFCAPSVSAALSQAEANRVDAERYRWLRDLPSGSEHEQIGNFPGDWWDEAIDAARLTNAVKTKG